MSDCQPSKLLRHLNLPTSSTSLPSQLLHNLIFPTWSTCPPYQLLHHIMFFLFCSVANMFHLSATYYRSNHVPIPLANWEPVARPMSSVPLARQTSGGRQSPRPEPMLRAMQLTNTKTRPNPNNLFPQWVLAPKV